MLKKFEWLLAKSVKITNVRRNFLKQTYLFFSRLSFLLFPTVLSLTLTNNSHSAEAGIVIAIYLYLALSKALVPIGMDLLIQQNVFLDLKNLNTNRYAPLTLLISAFRKFWLQRTLIVAILLLGTEFSSTRFGLENSYYNSFLLVSLYCFSGLTSILLSFFRNSASNLTTQIMDGFFVSLVPAIVSIIMIKVGFFSINIFLSILFLCQFTLFILLLSKLKRLIKSFSFDKVQNREPEFDSSQSIKAFLMISITTVNTRVAVLFVGWLLDPKYIILFDLLLKIYFLASLTTWSGAILNNQKYVISSFSRIKEFFFQQVLFALLVFAFGYILFLVLLCFGLIHSLINVDSLAIFVLGILLSHAFDIPSGVLGYIFAAKSKYNTIITAQFIYLFAICTALIFQKGIFAFLLILILSHVSRSIFFVCNFYKFIKVE